MLIKIENLPRAIVYVELTGTELEVLARIVEKLTEYESEYIGEKPYLIERGEMVPPTFTIETKRPVIISREQADALKAENAKKAFKEHFAMIRANWIAGEFGEAQEEAKRLVSTIYYQTGHITYNERDAYKWENHLMAADVEVLVFRKTDGTTIRVCQDGEILKTV